MADFATVEDDASMWRALEHLLGAEGNTRDENLARSGQG
jgi:hypothetical protein